MVETLSAPMIELVVTALTLFCLTPITFLIGWSFVSIADQLYSGIMEYVRRFK